MRSLILPGLLLAPISDGREWTDLNQRKIQAEMVRMEGGNIVLKLADGRELPYPLAKLSEADQAYASQISRTAKPAVYGPASAGFDAPWPDKVSFDGDPEIATISETAERKQFIYESANYRYTCDVRLSKSVVKGFAVLFEATNRYCSLLPISMAAGKSGDEKHQIRLFEKKEDYIAAGGPPESAGVFISGIGENEVLVPLESLGVRPVGSGYMLDRDKSNNTVPHELTHQLTPREYFDPAARGWFTEGLAEYVAVTKYRAGIFNVRNNRRAFVEYVTAYGKKGRGGRALGKEIHIGSLEKFMAMPYSEFMANGQMNYGCGLLLTAYFFHMDGNGDAARIKAFLKALREGKPGAEARVLLLNGRSYGTLEKEIAKAWSRHGIDLRFSGAAESE